jgi:RimJ/RimL family protein N-acetyltransferase
MDGADLATQLDAGAPAPEPGWFLTRDGRRLAVRTIRAADARLLIDLFARLSSESRRRRFRINLDRLDHEAKWDAARVLAGVDNRTWGGAVVAVDRDAQGCEELVGVARLAREPAHPDSPEAEVAVVVRDDFQGRGVGRELLRGLVRLAKQMGVRTLIAQIEADNEPALRLFRSLGLPSETTVSQAEVEMRLAVPEF